MPNTAPRLRDLKEVTDRRTTIQTILCNGFLLKHENGAPVFFYTPAQAKAFCDRANQDREAGEGRYHFKGVKI